MDIFKLELLNKLKQHDEIRDWMMVEQATLSRSSIYNISLTLLCAAIILKEKLVFNTVIDNDYLQSREQEKTFLGKTVWHFLASSGNYEALITAIEDGKFNPDTLKNKDGLTVWHYLAWSGNYEALINAITDGRFIAETLKSNIGLTVWHYLAFSGNYNALIQAIADNRFNIDTFQNKNGTTVWHFLALSGNYEAIIKAIEDGKFNPDTLKNKDGLTVWHCLALSGNYAALITAIEDGKFNPDTLKSTAGLNVWYFLALSGNYEGLIEAITHSKFNPNTSSNDGSTVWHYLAYSGNYRALITAIEDVKFNPDTLKSNDGLTVWHFLALSGNYEALVKAITDGAFNPDISTVNYLPVWHFLAYSGNYEALIQAIADGRFNPDTLKAHNGLTVWHFLALSGNYEALIQAISDDRFNPDTLEKINNTTVFGCCNEEYDIEWDKLCKANVDDLETVLHNSQYPELCFAFLNIKLKEARIKQNNTFIEYYKECIRGITEHLLTEKMEAPAFNKAIIEAVKSNYLVKSFALGMTNAELLSNFISKLIKHSPGNTRLIEEFLLVLREIEVSNRVASNGHITAQLNKRPRVVACDDSVYKGYFVWLWCNKERGVCSSFNQMWAKEITFLDEKTKTIQRAFRAKLSRTRCINHRE